MKEYRAGCLVKHRTNLVNGYKTVTVNVTANHRDEARNKLVDMDFGDYKLQAVEYINETPAYHPELVDDHCELPNCS